MCILHRFYRPHEILIEVLRGFMKIVNNKQQNGESDIPLRKIPNKLGQKRLS